MNKYIRTFNDFSLNEGIFDIFRSKKETAPRFGYSPDNSKDSYLKSATHSQINLTYETSWDASFVVDISGDLITQGKYSYVITPRKIKVSPTYRGSIDNEELRSELPTFDILAYPNTFEETSCIAVIEALSAGLRVVTSSLGALPETTEGWARMYSFIHNKERHAKVFAEILSEEIEKIRTGELDQHLELQKQVYAPRWSWDQRIKEWTNFLNTLIQPEQSI